MQKYQNNLKNKAMKITATIETTDFSEFDAMSIRNNGEDEVAVTVDLEAEGIVTDLDAERLRLVSLELFKASSAIKSIMNQ